LREAVCAIFRDFFARKLETVKPGLFEEPVEHAPARF
jgi:hypothetical protein